MNSKSLAAMDCLQRLSAFRAITDKQERRTAVQECYQVLLKKWSKEPNWNGMPRHLIEDVHGMFRNGFSRMLKDAEKRSKVNVNAFKTLNQSLHHHHGNEDHMWFPRLKMLHREFVPELEILEEDHRELVRLEKQIEKGDLEALRQFCDHLFDHLIREEMITVPFLLDGTGGF
ncbi:hypothetical protein EDD86DRAFT_265955 [Gorgonomyces haynaldii]|nr:hypothetical protein EDD86DRAFT_265955 [Gorgonomyces haynaldii]